MLTISNHVAGDPKAKIGIVLLPGRGGDAWDLADMYKEKLNFSANILGLTHPKRAWYPIPNGPKDQQQSVEKIGESALLISKEVEKFKTTTGVEKLYIAGHSAGGVMALQVGVLGDYDGIIVHSGAMLKPVEIDVPVLLTHSKDDRVFTWDERYIPMRNHLKQFGKLATMECRTAGHSLTENQVAKAIQFIARIS